MRLVHSEILKRDNRESTICYTSQNIVEVFHIYAVEWTVIPLNAIQWNGRQVIIDCADIPHDVDIYITYTADNSQYMNDVISINRMVEEVYNKFWGRRNCEIDEMYIKEKLVFHINYLNRTKINEYYNKQFCFQKVVDEIRTCTCLQSSCCWKCTIEIPKHKPSCGCQNQEKHEEWCDFSELVEVTPPKKRFKLPENAPKSGMLRLPTGEFVWYALMEDWLHLDSQHEINELWDYTIWYWIPTHDVLSVSVGWKKTTNFDIHKQYIFLKDKTECDVCIEYVEKYSECNISDLCVKFDSTFWKLPVYETIVELAVDSEDTRVASWSAQLQKMKHDYTIIISKTHMNFDNFNDKITRVPRRYNGHMNIWNNYAPFTIPKLCRNCK